MFVTATSNHLYRSTTQSTSSTCRRNASVNVSRKSSRRVALIQITATSHACGNITDRSTGIQDREYYSHTRNSIVLSNDFSTSLGRLTWFQQQEQQRQQRQQQQHHRCMSTIDPSMISRSPQLQQQATSSIQSLNNVTTSTAANNTDIMTSTPLSTTTIPDIFYSNMYNASIWQPNKIHWNINVCRLLVAQYDTYLRHIVEQKRYAKNITNSTTGTGSTNQSSELSSTTSTIPNTSTISEPPPTTLISTESIERLLSADMVIVAFKVLIKCKVDSPMDLAANVRQWERYIGHIGKTPLTDHLSLRLLTANAKSGNLGRCLSLLELRTQKQYPPRIREFLYTITAIQIAAGKPGTKNIYLGDTEQSALDNPTRWLDAILLSMKQRNQPLTKAIAYQMLSCYAGTGYTGKATHHFYRILRHPVENHHQYRNGINGNGTSATANISNATDESFSDIEDDDQNNVSDEKQQQEHQQQQEEQGLYHRPRDWFYVPDLGRHNYQETQVKMKFNRLQPPYYKVPAQVQGKLLRSIYDGPDSPGKLRIERESEPDYSIPLAAAFAFAHSLQQGACGHDPITFNVECYNALIKACVYRGALWRAMHVLDTVIKNASDDDGKPLRPNHISYNMILAGLARVGDVITAQRYYHKMLNDDQLEPDAFTVRAIVDGLLNLADAPAAITVVQDFFNQHSILPPYTTHCKILEFCLARGMIYEAKRYVYFIQQLWYWKPVEGYHSKSFIQLMRATQRNTQLQKPALQKLFAYFGETLTDSDFL